MTLLQNPNKPLDSVVRLLFIYLFICFFVLATVAPEQPRRPASEAAVNILRSAFVIKMSPDVTWELPWRALCSCLANM